MPASACVTGGAHKAFPTGEGGSRVSRKRETDEGKGSPSYGRGAFRVSKKSAKHVAFANPWFSGVGISSKCQDTSRRSAKAPLCKGSRQKSLIFA